MKKIKIILSTFLISYFAISCNIEGINNDLSSISTEATNNLSKIFDISTDNSGKVKITPLGVNANSYKIEFGHGTGANAYANVPAGSSAMHTYPEGSYTVTITAYDILGNQMVTTYPLVVTYTAPTSLILTIESDMQLKATAQNANSFLVDYGDGTSPVQMNTTINSTTAVATGVLPAHVYPAGGPYTITVTAQSGGAANTVYSKTLFGFPMSFENTAVDYFFGTFGNVNFTKVANPSPMGGNTSAMVGKYEKTVGAASWSGTYSPLNIPLNLAHGKKIKLMVYNPDASNIGKNINVELEGAIAGTGATANGVGVLKMPITQSGVWEEIVFDFNSITSIPSTARFGQLVLRFNDSAAGTGEVIYLDNFTQSN